MSVQKEEVFQLTFSLFLTEVSMQKTNQLKIDAKLLSKSQHRDLVLRVSSVITVAIKLILSPLLWILKLLLYRYTHVHIHHEDKQAV